MLSHQIGGFVSSGEESENEVKEAAVGQQMALQRCHILIPGN